MSTIRIGFTLADHVKLVIEIIDDLFYEDAMILLDLSGSCKRVQLLHLYEWE